MGWQRPLLLPDNQDLLQGRVLHALEPGLGFFESLNIMDDLFSDDFSRTDNRNTRRISHDQFAADLAAGRFEFVRALIGIESLFGYQSQLWYPCLLYTSRCV